MLFHFNGKFIFVSSIKVELKFSLHTFGENELFRSGLNFIISVEGQNRIFMFYATSSESRN